MSDGGKGYTMIGEAERSDIALAFALFGYPAEVVEGIMKDKPQGTSPSPRMGASGRET